MKRREAEDLIAMMAAASRGSEELTATKKAFWLEQLENLDAEQATQAVLRGITVWEFFPSWPEFARFHTEVGREKAAMKERDERIGEYEQIRKSKTNFEVPFWVKRWVCATMLYARFGKDRDDRRFVEMGSYADVTLPAMPDDAWVEEAKTLSDAETWRAIRPEMGAAA